MKPFERLLKYISIRTPSDEASTTVPSSTCQFELAWHLHRELFTRGSLSTRRSMTSSARSFRICTTCLRKRKDRPMRSWSR